jgi:hypothetical protein
VTDGGATSDGPNFITKKQEGFHEEAGRKIRALRAGRDPVPREAPMSFCSVILVTTFLLLREGNHEIARTDNRPGTSSRLGLSHRIPRNRGAPA